MPEVRAPHSTPSTTRWSQAAPTGSLYSVGLDDSTSFSFDKIQGRYQDQSLRTLQEVAEQG